jgi:hypothetical protein
VVEVPLFNSFSAAFIGFGRRLDKVVAVYSYEKCIEVLVEQSGLSEEEAEEYMEYNVVGAYVGDQTPIFMIEVNIDDRESLQ